MKELTVIAIKRDDNLYHFNHSHNETVEELLMNGTEEDVIDFIDNVRRVHEQIIDTVNLDRVTAVGWDAQARERALHLIEDFSSFMERHRDEITALKIYYNQQIGRAHV